MNDLELAANKFDCDKGSLENGHRFTDIYFDYWESLRHKELNILEIGVWKGAGLRTLREFFSNSSIYGIDVQDFTPSDLYDGGRIQTFLCDQADKSKLYEIFNDIQFDIILDDGCHNVIYQQKTFGYLFKFLKSNGIYIIEDLHTSLMGSTWGLEPNDKYTTLSILREAEKTNQIETPHIDMQDINYINENIKSVKVYDTKSTVPIPSSPHCTYKCDLTSVIIKG